MPRQLVTRATLWGELGKAPCIFGEVSVLRRPMKRWTLLMLENDGSPACFFGRGLHGDYPSCCAVFSVQVRLNVPFHHPRFDMVLPFCYGLLRLVLRCRLSLYHRMHAINTNIAESRDWLAQILIGSAIKGHAIDGRLSVRYSAMAQQDDKFLHQFSAAS